MPYTAILVLIGLAFILRTRANSNFFSGLLEIKDSSFTSEFLAAEARQKESYNVYLSFHTFQS